VSGFTSHANSLVFSATKQELQRQLKRKCKCAEGSPCLCTFKSQLGYFARGNIKLYMKLWKNKLGVKPDSKRPGIWHLGDNPLKMPVWNPNGVLPTFRRRMTTPWIGHLNRPLMPSEQAASMGWACCPWQPNFRPFTDHEISKSIGLLRNSVHLATITAVMAAALGSVRSASFQGQALRVSSEEVLLEKFRHWVAMQNNGTPLEEALLSQFQRATQKAGA
jgi:hypothetical protein